MLLINLLSKFNQFTMKLDKVNLKSAIMFICLPPFKGEKKKNDGK